MRKYFFKKLLTTLLLLFVSSSLIFSVLFFAVGDPTEIILFESITPETKQALRSKLGLDRPFIEQYLKFIWKLFTRFDLGNSWYAGTSVISYVSGAYFNTLRLTLFSGIIVCFLGIPVGILSAYYKETRIGEFLNTFIIFSISIPGFVIALFLMYIFAFRLDYFPIYGTGGLRYIFLPALSLSLYAAVNLARITRSIMLNVLSEDYITAARAKGLSELSIVLFHALRNALIPIITILGLQVGILMGGAMVVEIIFSWSGMGRLMFQAIFGRDFPVVRGAAIIFLFTIILVNTILDLLYTMINPQVKVY